MKNRNNPKLGMIHQYNKMDNDLESMISRKNVEVAYKNLMIILLLSKLRNVAYINNA